MLERRRGMHGDEYDLYLNDMQEVWRSDRSDSWRDHSDGDDSDAEVAAAPAEEAAAPAEEAAAPAEEAAAPAEEAAAPAEEAAAPAEEAAAPAEEAAAPAEEAAALAEEAAAPAEVQPGRAGAMLPGRDDVLQPGGVGAMHPRDVDANDANEAACEMFRQLCALDPTYERGLTNFVSVDGTWDVGPLAEELLSARANAPKSLAPALVGPELAQTELGSGTREDARATHELAQSELGAGTLDSVRAMGICVRRKRVRCNCLPRFPDGTGTRCPGPGVCLGRLTEEPAAVAATTRNPPAVPVIRRTRRREENTNGAPTPGVAAVVHKGGCVPSKGLARRSEMTNGDGATPEGARANKRQVEALESRGEVDHTRSVSTSSSVVNRCTNEGGRRSKRSRKPKLLRHANLHAASCVCKDCAP
jgi:chemotaxis protein histidine kinase CheA